MASCILFVQLKVISGEWGEGGVDNKQARATQQKNLDKGKQI